MNSRKEREKGLDIGSRSVDAPPLLVYNVVTVVIKGVCCQTGEALAKPSQTQAVRLAYGRVLQEFLMMRRGAAEQAGETGLFPCF